MPRHLVAALVDFDARAMKTGTFLDADPTSNAIAFTRTDHVVPSNVAWNDTSGPLRYKGCLS